MKSLLCVFILSVLLTGCDNSAHPTDEVMRDNFKLHEAEFEKVISMLKIDQKLERIDDSWTLPDDPSSIGISPSRIADYRRIFADIKVPRGVIVYNKTGRVLFLASALGLGISGSEKGYAYLQEESDLIVPSLDGYESPDHRSFTAYRHLKDHWYLYLDYED
jgi:hypothetical protein